MITDDDGGTATPAEPVAVNVWFEHWDAERRKLNTLANGGDTSAPLAEECKAAQRAFEDRRRVLLSPADARLREHAPKWVESSEQFYEACRDNDERRLSEVWLSMTRGRDPDPIAVRLQELGFAA